MTIPSNNPLQKHFRQASIYMELPSGGMYWPQGAIDIPVSKSLPVLPMTALDEIALRTPDGLFNGQSTVEVIQSCVPNIKDAWSMPTVDIDAVLVAIRIASYGQTMEVTSQCPKCNETSDYDFDLRVVADSFKNPDYNTPLVYNNVSVQLRPMSYKDVTDNSVIQFQERKIYEINSNAKIDVEEKIKQINEGLKHLTELSISAIAKSIVSITIDSNVATEQQHIVEYLQNCDSKLFSAIRDKITALRAESEATPLHIVCPACNHEYNSPFVLDLSNFFA